MNSFLKLTSDILTAFITLILLSPFFLIIALIIKFTSPGPVFYRGKRVGKNGKIFLMYKFRSMVMNADKIGSELTRHEDPRITKIGKFLRSTKIDELPNIIDVLVGNMSIIGPRPESPSYTKYYNERQKRVLDVRPGITGLSQIENRNEELKLKDKPDPDKYYIEELMPKKVETDLYYIENMSFFMDMKILWKTLLTVIAKKD